MELGGQLGATASEGEGFIVFQPCPSERRGLGSLPLTETGHSIGDFKGFGAN